MEDVSKIPPAPKIPLPPSIQKERNQIPKPKIIRKKEFVYLDNDIQFQPPNAIEFEEAVLGGFLVDKRALQSIELLEPEIFYDESHRYIFEAIQNLYQQSLQVDLLTVSEELRRVGKIERVGGSYYLVQLSQKISTALNIEYHIRILCQKYVLRELISMSRETLHDSLHNDPDIFNLIDEIEINISRISTTGIKNINPAESDATEELKRKVQMKRDGIPVGYPTGMDEFDNWCGGFQRRWLAIIGARPGMGKTSAIIAIIYHMAFIKGIKVVFFSLEMSKIDIEYRLAARMTGIPFQKINMGDLTDDELEHVADACSKIEDHGIKIIDNVINLHKITAETKKLKSEGYEVFMLDYLQLIEISGNTGDMTGEMVKITRTLKTLKNDLNIPFIALSQIDRSVDNRPDKRPQISDLKQSSSIEQDADMVIFLLRMAYYNQGDNKIPIAPGKPNPDYVAEWIVAKGRSTGVRDFSVYLNLSEFILQSGSSVQF